MRTRLLVFLTIAASLAFSSCSSHRTVVYSSGSPKLGPPPHAPAHGYRHRHNDGVILVYDSRLAIYAVHKYPQHYFHADHFYRCRGNVWEVSISLEGPWATTSIDRLPPGLQKDAKKESKKKEASKGRGRDKRW